MYFWQVLKSLNCQWIFQTRYISQHNSNFYSYHIYSTDYCIHTIFIPQTTIFIPYLFHRLLYSYHIYSTDYCRMVCVYSKKLSQQWMQFQVQGSSKNNVTNTVRSSTLFWLQCMHGMWVADGTFQTCTVTIDIEASVPLWHQGLYPSVEEISVKC